ncbi:hypothetical protein [Robertmurraya kyonggiensis]|uniref:hypothetical protein n=1 Tax=Robertmurraya kyonggiensis TaxID=1037680 RepID=UPI00130EBAD0|nr:hypothetical protein [Robertmurraya kyonggiensis]
MKTGEMLVLTNRLKEILETPSTELKTVRLGILLDDVEDAYVGDEYAAQLYSTVHEHLN